MAEDIRKVVLVVQEDRKTTANIKRFESTLTRAFRGSERSASRVIRAFTAFRGSVGGIAGALVSLKGAIIGAGLGLLAKRAVSAAAKQEDAINRLNAALKTAGVFTEELSKQAQDLATALQRQTRFGDEAILSAEQLLITFGVTADQLERATKVTLDFAAATGRDLTAAAQVVGKAAAGFTGELGRYGIQIEKGLKGTDKFSAVLVKMQTLFGGFAAKELNTFNGVMAQLGNLIGDLFEVFGDAIVKSDTFKDAIRDLSIGVSVLVDSLKTQPVTKFGKSLSGIIPTAETLTLIFFGLRRTLLTVLGAVKLGQSAFIASEIVLLKIAAAIREVAGPALRALGKGFIILSSTIGRAVGGILKQTSLLVGELSDLAKKLNIDIAQDLGKKLAVLTVNMFTAGVEAEELAKTISIGLGIGFKAAGNEAEELARKIRARIPALEADLKAAEVEMSLLGDAIKRGGVESDELIKRIQELRIQMQKLREDAAKVPVPLVLAALTTNATLTALTQGFQATSIASVESFSRSVGQIVAQDFVTQKQRAKNAEITNKSLLFGATATAGALLKITEAFGARSVAARKAFAVAEAVINTARAITEVLPNFPLAAAVGILGAAQIATILAAKPGAGVPGGVAAVAPPAAIPEAPVIAAPGGGGPTINITVAGFVGDEALLAEQLTRIMREALGDGMEIGLRV